MVTRFSMCSKRTFFDPPRILRSSRRLFIWRFLNKSGQPISTSSIVSPVAGGQGAIGAAAQKRGLYESIATSLPTDHMFSCRKVLRVKPSKIFRHIVGALLRSLLRRFHRAAYPRVERASFLGGPGRLRGLYNERFIDEDLSPKLRLPVLKDTSPFTDRRSTMEIVSPSLRAAPSRLAISVSASASRSTLTFSPASSSWLTRL